MYTRMMTNEVESAFTDPTEMGTPPPLLMIGRPFLKRTNPATLSTQPAGDRLFFIYDWGQIASEVINEADVNLTGNFYKIGPSSRPERGAFVNGKVKVYSQGNISPIRPDSSLPEDAILKPWGKTDRSAFAVTTPFAAPTLPVLSAVENYKAVLVDAGATRPKLDSVDQRILADVKNSTGKIINHPSEVGGWPTLAAGDLPDVRYNDGIPDIWVKVHGLNSDDAEDRNGSRQPVGYTHLEEYLNDID